MSDRHVQLPAAERHDGAASGLDAGGKVEAARAPDPRSGLDEEGRWTPAFPGQRRPFEPGHRLTLKHGVFSKPALAPRAGEITDELRALLDRELGAATSPADEPTIRLLAITLAQVEAAHLWLAEHGLVTEDGRPAPLLKHLGTMLNTASRLADRLGLTPTSRAALGLDIARTGDELEQYLQKRRRQEAGS